MADDQYRWIGELQNPPGNDFSVAANWLDVTTERIATTVPGPGDSASFDAVPADAGTILVLSPQSVGTLFVIDKSDVTLQGVTGSPPGTVDMPQTLTAGTVYIGTGHSPTDTGILSTYGVALDITHSLTMRATTLENAPGVPGGIAIGAPGYTPHAEVHVGSAGFLLATGGSFIPNLTDDGSVEFSEGGVTIANPGGTLGGVSGSGSIDVQGGPESAVLDLTQAGFADPARLNSIGTLHVEQYAGLNLGKVNLEVTHDFVNDNTGTGNAYNPLADVTSDGGGVLGNGAQVGIGGAVLGKDGVYTLDLGSFVVGQTVDSSYTVTNTGTVGAADLRGAIQTDANGGTIIDPGLSGSGLEAQNFGPIAAGSSSDAYGVTLSADKLGTNLLAQLHFATGFSDSGSATLDIVGTGVLGTAPPPTPWEQLVTQFTSLEHAIGTIGAISELGSELRGSLGALHGTFGPWPTLA